jgi:peptidoglycan pentaglycine glycine transferase (the first glycine)
MALISNKDWDAFLELHPEAHLLQTTEWGKLKERFGWKSYNFAESDCGAKVLLKPLPFGFHVAYIAKGPVGKDWKRIIPELDRFCRKNRTVLLKVEPDVWEPPEKEVCANLLGFQPNAATVQPRRTMIVSLQGTEDQWLSRMKQKTRYNIQLSRKKDVKVELSNDVGGFARIMTKTGMRDGFGVHVADYYQTAYDLFKSKNDCQLLMAHFEQKYLAGLMVFKRNDRSWYLFGGSGDEERQRMPSYLVQWEGMRWAASQGCKEYDLWGVPDIDEAQLEANFAQRSDGLWGVYRFKRGFGGKIKRSIGAWEKVYQPLMYRFYLWWTKRRAE